MKIENCRFCQTSLPSPKILKVLEAKLDKYTCPKCGLIQTPESKVDYSSGDLVSYYEDRRTWINHRHKYIFETVEKILNKKDIKFLDIGCGIGFSLLEAKNRGWTGFGIEPNKDLAIYAREKLSVNVVNSYFPSTVLPEQKYDFILIDNVIEHLSNPAAMIENASKLLAENGILLIAVPPVDWARLMLSKFSYVRGKITSATVNMYNDTYEHINFIPRAAMKEISIKNNLEIININFHHHKKFELIQNIVGLESGYYFLKKTN